MRVNPHTQLILRLTKLNEIRKYKMQSHQLNALLTESSPVKVATSQIGSDLVYGKAGSIVGDPSFIKTMVARVIFSNYGFNSVSDKTTTQATLHSRFARVCEYQFKGNFRRSFPNSDFVRTSLNNNIKRNKEVLKDVRAR